MKAFGVKIIRFVNQGLLYFDEVNYFYLQVKGWTILLEQLFYWFVTTHLSRQDCVILGRSLNFRLSPPFSVLCLTERKERSGGGIAK